MEKRLALVGVLLLSKLLNRRFDIPSYSTPSYPVSCHFIPEVDIRSKRLSDRARPEQLVRDRGELTRTGSLKAHKTSPSPDTGTGEKIAMIAMGYDTQGYEALARQHF